MAYKGVKYTVEGKKRRVEGSNSFFLTRKKRVDVMGYVDMDIGRVNSTQRSVKKKHAYCYYL